MIFNLVCIKHPCPPIYVNYQSKLLEVMLLHQTEHKANKSSHIQREGDEPVVGSKWPQDILQKRDLSKAIYFISKIT